MKAYQHFINGKWLAGSETLPVVNPSDGQIVARIPRAGVKEINGLVLVAIRVKGEADALRMANGTPFGVASGRGIWAAPCGSRAAFAPGRYSSTTTELRAASNCRSAA